MSRVQLFRPAREPRSYFFFILTRMFKTPFNSQMSGTAYIHNTPFLVG